MWTKILNFIISLAIFAIVAMTLHEYCHYGVANLMGVNGYVTYSSLFGLFGAYFVPTSPLPSCGWIIYLSGGIGCSIILFALWILATRVGIPWDMDDASSLYLVAMVQLFYGISELILYFDQTVFNVIWPIAISIGAVIGVIVYGRRLYTWWLGYEY